MCSLFPLKNCFPPKGYCLSDHSDCLGLGIWSKPLIMSHTLMMGLVHGENITHTNQRPYLGFFKTGSMGREPLFSQSYEIVSPELTSAISLTTQRSLFTVREESIQQILRQEMSDRRIFMAFECLGQLILTQLHCPSPQFGYIGFLTSHHIGISYLKFLSFTHLQFNNPTTDV